MSAYKNCGTESRQAFRYVMELVGLTTAATGKLSGELLWISTIPC